MARFTELGILSTMINTYGTTKKRPKKLTSLMKQDILIAEI